MSQMTGIPHVQACPNLIGTNPSRESRDDPNQLKHMASPPSKYCSNKIVQSMAFSARTPWHPSNVFHIHMEVLYWENHL